MSEPQVFCVILARGGSKAIPRKNVMDFCGKPLVQWSIEQAKESHLIDKIYVSSDSDEILEISQKAGANLIKRPAALATDTASSEDALLHAVEHIEESLKEKLETIVFLQPTSPLRKPGDIDGAIKLFLQEKADSLFSAVLLEDHCIWEHQAGQYRSLTFDFNNRGRRQERAPLYLENGSIYVFKPEILRKNRNRLGGKIITYPMSFWQSYEIDNQDDTGVCEYFMETKIRNRQLNFIK